METKKSLLFLLAVLNVAKFKHFWYAKRIQCTEAFFCAIRV